MGGVPVFSLDSRFPLFTCLIFACFAFMFVISWRMTLMILGAAAALGAVVVRIALRPLDRVVATATRVSELPLDEGEVQLAERVPESATAPGTEVGRVGSALNRLLGRLINLPLSLVRSLKRRLISILDGMHRSVPGAPERHGSRHRKLPQRPFEERT